MNIKSYDDDAYSYSGTDEEYAEFLKSIDGKLNEGEPVEDTDLGDTKKINLQGVIEKFRKTADGIKDVSKKITAEAVNKIEDFKKSREAHTEEVSTDDYYEPSSEYAENAVTPEPVNESMDIEPLYDRLKLISDKSDDILAETEKLRDKINTFEINGRDISLNIEDIKHKTDTVSSGIEEIRKAVSGINKLNDSVFDLKNAQLNSKNSLEELEKGFMSLKKKCIWGVAIISILTLISIAMEVIILLS